MHHTVAHSPDGSTAFPTKVHHTVAHSPDDPTAFPTREHQGQGSSSTSLSPTQTQSSPTENVSSTVSPPSLQLNQSELWETHSNDTRKSHLKMEPNRMSNFSLNASQVLDFTILQGN